MKIKLAFLPRYHMNPDTGEPDTGLAKFLPLGVSTVTSYLRQNNVDVDLDDLDAKVMDFNQTNTMETEIRMDLFADKKRIKKFVKKGEHPVLEREGEKVLALTECKGYDIFGFSLNIPDNPSTIGVALVLGKLLKEKYGTTVVVGGGFGDDISKRLLKDGFIDYVIHGGPVTSIAEVNMLKFCRSYERRGDVESVDGLIYREGDKLVRTKEENEYNSDERFLITKPDFDGLPLELYRRKFRCEVNGEEIEKGVTFLPYFFIRGCPNACSFCTYADERWQKKDVNTVVNELEEMSNEYDVENFFFLNTELNCSYDYAERFAEEVIERDLDINFTDCATFRRMNEELLRKLKRAGAIRLVYGMESGNPKMLSTVKRPNFSHSEAEDILKKMRQLGILSQIDVIIGFPYENEFDVDCTIDFIKKNRKYLTGGINLNKFYLNGPMIKRPERFAIQKIKQEKLKRNWSTEAYNEKYGRSWDEKVNKTSELYDKINKSLDPALGFVPTAHELFYISSTPRLKNLFLNDKNPPEIKEIIE